MIRLHVKRFTVNLEDKLFVYTKKSIYEYYLIEFDACFCNG